MVGIEQEPLELCGNIMLYIHLEVELHPQAQAGSWWIPPLFAITVLPLIDWENRGFFGLKELATAPNCSFKQERPGSLTLDVNGCCNRMDICGFNMFQLFLCVKMGVASSVLMAWIILDLYSNVSWILCLQWKGDTQLSPRILTMAPLERSPVTIADPTSGFTHCNWSSSWGSYLFFSR